jgi:hypothetical protein
LRIVGEGEVEGLDVGLDGEGLFEVAVGVEGRVYWPGWTLVKV